jgi:uncharacterized protein (DUF305 family)
MKPKPLFLTALLAAALLLAGCGSSMDHEGMGSSPSSTAPAPSASGTAPASMHNEADVMFATMMIPHHAQAIEMSDMLLAKDGIDPKVRDLAERIKAAQGPEIAQMRDWLSSWGENPSPAGGGHGGHDGGGMMGQAEMDALEKASGAEARDLFLSGMIKHHEGAVVMAETELRDGANADAKRLAQAIIDAQNQEIEEMKALLRG